VKGLAAARIALRSSSTAFTISARLTECRVRTCRHAARADPANTGWPALHTLPRVALQRQSLVTAYAAAVTGPH